MPRPPERHPFTERLRLRNFTVFQDTAFEFVPGVNVFIGENGSGKTHAMKALFAWQYVRARAQHLDPKETLRELKETLRNLFQTQDPGDVVRLGAEDGSSAEVSGSLGGNAWSYAVRRNHLRSESQAPSPGAARPVFIPALDMMGHTRGFTEAYAEVRLDFDLTCADVVNLLRLERRDSPGNRNGATQALAALFGGPLERDEAGRFYLITENGRMPMPMVAEGLRKIATLVRLHSNGWLMPGTALFWDEPEVNLNPVLMDEVVAAILGLARSGVQVFLATHSYVILREIEVQATGEDSFRYFALESTPEGVISRAADSYLGISPNPIERQYAELYDRGIRKRLTAAEGR